MNTRMKTAIENNFKLRIGAILMALIIALAFTPMMPGGSGTVHAATSTQTVTLNSTPGKSVKITGSIGPKSTQYFKFKTSSRSSFYEIKVINSECDNYIRAELEDQDHAKISGLDFIRQGSKKTFDFLFDGEKLQPDTTHYLKIYPMDTSKNTSYVIYITEYPDDCGDVKSDARSIKLGKTNCHMDVKDFKGRDYDWMVFTAPAKSTYTFKLRNFSVPKNNLSWERFDHDGAGTGDRVSFHWQDEVYTWTVKLSKGEKTYIRALSGDAGKYSIQVKRANPVKVTAASKKVSAKTLKKSKVRVKAVTVKNAQGKVTFKKVGGSSKLTVSKSSGKITVKKNTKKGTYKIKVKVKAAGSSKYSSKSKTKTVKVIVK